MSSVTHVLFHPEALSGGASATPQHKSLQNLDVIDNFLFTTLSSLPDVAEPFFRIILRSVFGYDFPEIKVTAQKVVQGLDTTLPDFVSIVILSYDPFGCGDMFYESRSHFVSHPGIAYDDGIRRIYLYADGRLNADAIRAAGLGDGKNLQSVIKYMCHSKADNVSGADTKEMSALVSEVKARREVGVSFMRWWDYIESVKREVKEEALAEGRATGLAEGRAEGRAEARCADAAFHVISCRRLGASDEDILRDLTGHFSLTEEEARTLLDETGVEAVVQ